MGVLMGGRVEGDEEEEGGRGEKTCPLGPREPVNMGDDDDEVDDDPDADEEENDDDDDGPGTPEGQ